MISVFSGNGRAIWARRNTNFATKLEIGEQYELGEIIIVNSMGWFQPHLEIVGQYGLEEILILNSKG